MQKLLSFQLVPKYVCCAMISVIYEDAALIVVEKPAGTPVYPFGPFDPGTLAQSLTERYPELAQVGPPLQAGTIHRLDNHTSGLIVVGRTAASFDALCAQWNNHETLKEYTALALRDTPPHAVIKTAIAHHPRKKRKMLVCESERKIKHYKAREAHTEFETLKTYRLGPGLVYSLLRVEITTGVRHQIRVHLASIGHPLAGDRLYQNALKRMQDRTGLNRQFLHLGRVVLKHPTTGKRIEVVCNLPPDLQSVLDSLD